MKFTPLTDILEPKQKRHTPSRVSDDADDRLIINSFWPYSSKRFEMTKKYREPMAAKRAWKVEKPLNP